MKRTLLVILLLIITIILIFLIADHYGYGLNLNEPRNSHCGEGIPPRNCLL